MSTTKLMTRAAFTKATGLTEITARTGGYDTLYRQIAEHRWYLGQAGLVVDIPVAAADWQEAVFRPAVAAIAATDLATRFPKASPADLYLMICERKWCLSEQAGQDVGFAAALAAVLADPIAPTRTRRSRSAA